MRRGIIAVGNYYLDHISARCSNPGVNRLVNRTARRSLATRRDVIAGVSIGIGSLAMSKGTVFTPSQEISHSGESIHQEVRLRATPARVYAALTDPDQFQKV